MSNTDPRWLSRCCHINPKWDVNSDCLCTQPLGRGDGLPEYFHPRIMSSVGIELSCSASDVFWEENQESYCCEICVLWAV